MSRNAWIIFVIACVAILGGLVFFSNQNKVSVNVEDVARSKVLPASEASGNIGDHVIGKADSQVVLIEYADFQCGGCAGAYTRIKAIVEEYGDRIAIVNRHIPLTSIHPHALAAAATAEAAGLQGKYDEMAELLYANQNSWSTLGASDRAETFLSYARQLKLDETKFTADQSSPQVSQKITFDQALAKKDGVSSTPSFYLNGEKVSQEIWADEKVFKALLEAALAQT